MVVMICSEPSHNPQLLRMSGPSIVALPIPCSHVPLRNFVMSPTPVGSFVFTPYSDEPPTGGSDFQGENPGIQQGYTTQTPRHDGDSCVSFVGIARKLQGKDGAQRCGLGLGSDNLMTTCCFVCLTNANLVLHVLLMSYSRFTRQDPRIIRAS